MVHRSCLAGSNHSFARHHPWFHCVHLRSSFLSDAVSSNPPHVLPVLPGVGQRCGGVHAVRLPDLLTALGAQTRGGVQRRELFHRCSCSDGSAGAQALQSSIPVLS